MTKKEENKGVNFISFGYNDYQTPRMNIVKKRKSEFVNYGDDNLFPQFLDKLLNSAEHSAILDSKVDYIAGEGFDIEQLKPTEKAWFANNDMDSLLQKIARDYELYGGFCFYVIRTKDGQRIARLVYEDFSKVRIEADKATGDIKDSFLISDDWDAWSPSTKSVPLYKKDGNEAKSLFYYKGNSKELYPLPKYYGALSAIETGIQIDKFQLNLVKNGFHIPTVFTFNGPIPTEEEQEQLERDLEAKFAGADKAGKFFMLFNEGDGTAVDIERLDVDDLDEQFVTVAEQTQQKIFIGHRVTSPMLFGVKTEGQLGGRTEMVEAYELFKKTYIEPTQNTLEGVLEELLSINFPDINIKLIARTPIEAQIPEERLYQNMTRMEIRKQAGLEDGELTDQEKTIMKLHDLPSEVRSAFVSKLSDEELFKLIGFERNENDNEINDEQ